MNTASAPSARETTRALYGYVRPHRWLIMLGLVCTLAGTAGGLVQPLATKALMDRLAAGQTITAILLALTALVLVGTVADATGAYVLERTAESVVLAARRTLVGRLLRLPLAEAERIPPGDLMSRVTSDTTLLRTASTHAIVAAATGSVSFVAAIVIMAVLDATLLMATLGVLALMGVLVALVMPRIATATERSQEAVAEVSSELERAVGAFTTVKASGAEQRESDRIDAAARRAWRHGLSSAKWEALAGSADGLAVQLAFLAVLGIGGARVAAGTLPVSTLIAFLLYLFYLIEPVSRLVEAVSQFQESAAAITRINRVNDLPTEPLPERQPAPEHHRGPASIRFEQVSFRYRPDLPYLYEQVTFGVPAGGMTAVVGPSGSGKSTVLALIERFYDVTTGRILVDGRDVRDWPLDELRSMIGYVQQDAPVLAGTLRDNLTHAAPEASDEEVAEVLELTNLTALVDRLPDGLNTPVGHRGATLSGGERQRIAIARALLRRPRILLLDEPTSQLDAANEQELTALIARTAELTTVLVVAHRLSTVTNADRIIVVNGGQVRAVGTRQELLAHAHLRAVGGEPAHLTGDDTAQQARPRLSGVRFPT